jgi:hypothetical protein
MLQAALCADRMTDFFPAAPATSTKALLDGMRKEI